MNSTNNTQRYDPLARIFNASSHLNTKDLLTRQSRTVSYGVSGIVTLLSLVGMATSTQWIRNLSALGLTSGLTLTSATCLVSNRINETFKDYLDKQALEHDRTLKLLSDVSIERDKLLKQLDAEREGARKTISELGAKLFSFSNGYKDISAQNGTLKGELEALEKQLQQKSFDEDKTYKRLIYGFTEAVKVELGILVNERLANMREFIFDKVSRFSDTPTEKALTQLVELIDTKLEVYRDIIVGLTPDYENPENDLKEFVSVFNQIHDEVSSIKVRFKNALTVNERLRLKESVDRQYAVDQLEKLARSQDEFQLSYEQALDEIERLVAVVEQHRARILDLESELSASKVTPVEFNPASRDDLRMGNIVIRYFHKQGVWLDRGFSKYQGHKATLSFHADRNDPPITVDTLNKHSEALQDLLKCLNLPEFKRNADTGMVDVLLEITPRPKVEATQGDEDINRIWKPATEFKKVVADFSRVRITGGSEAGKSPTAENLAVTILENRPGLPCLYNPQFDSQKNHWSIPTVGKSHEDSARGIKSLAAKVKARSESEESREVHYLHIFDEIDSTMGESSSPRELGDAVKYIIKQASHQNLSAIFIGQSANVSNYPGMQRTDWNSAVNIHIGANAYDAIVNSNQFTTRQADALRTQADRLTEYCERKNAELGLDAKHPKAFRFALVIEPNKAPYYIELPEFGLYKYTEKTLVSSRTDEVMNRSISLSSSLEAVTEPSRRAIGVLTVTCPSCSSENVRKHGSYKDRARYKCLNDLCSKKTFTV